MSGEAQNQLDTRALEIASKTEGMLERHLNECDRRGQELSDGLKDMRGSISRVHERIDEATRAGADWKLKVAAALIGLLVMALGAVFMSGLPWQ